MSRKPTRFPKYLLPGNVYDAALNRIRWLYDEFDTVAVSSSGGKDSTVVVELALIVAAEKDRLPLRVHWLDQECEFASTVDYQRHTLNDRPEIDGAWWQVPFRLFNATSHEQTWLNVWGEGEEWVRPKEPDSIHENPWPDVDRFTELLDQIGLADGGCILTGVRGEESPARRTGLTTYPTYKWATWGSRRKTTGHLTFHPIYDWATGDVWKAIHENGWPYNEHYDAMYRYGIPPSKMRVSNYHHETAIPSLFMLQEIEPDTWEAATKRLQGVATAGQIGKADYMPKELPFMFGTWTEYRDYLLENLVQDDEDRATFAKQFDGLDRTLWYVDEQKRSRAEVQALIVNDVYYTKLNQFFLMNHLSIADQKRYGLIDENGERIK